MYYSCHSEHNAPRGLAPRGRHIARLSVLLSSAGSPGIWCTDRTVTSGPLTGDLDEIKDSPDVRGVWTIAP